MLQEACSAPVWKRMGLKISEHAWVLLTPILGLTFIRTLKRQSKSILNTVQGHMGILSNKNVYRDLNILALL